jgi:uncharacterized membrane protein YhaH (DUF805 family)
MARVCRRKTNCLTHLNLYHAATRSCLVTTASVPKWMIWRGRYSALWGCSQNPPGVSFFFLLAISALLGKEELDPQKGTSKLTNLYNLATLPLYWPSFALYLKRVHDFGQGQLWALPLLVLAGFIFGLSAAGYDMAASLAFPVILVVLIVVGSIKGTPGPNQYGPDPLANTARKSAM